MKKWIVCNWKMDCIGIVIAEDFNDAWRIANSKYRNVDYVRPL